MISLVLSAIVTLFGVPPNVASCQYIGAVADANGNFQFTCAKSDPVPPIPPVTPPVGCVVKPVRTDFPKAGTSPPFVSQLGIVNTWGLPAVSGLVSSTNEYPGTPQGLTVEWAISKCPGDFEYYKTDAAKITNPRGQKIIVCGGTGSLSAGVKWGMPDACVTSTTEPWYINLRYISGGQPNTNYTITMGLAL